MPERFFMEGINEAHAVGMAAGLAMEGKIVYVNTIATFLTRRCFEQVVLDLCMHNVRVRLIGNGGGVVYAPLGPTHLAFEDLAILRAVPNMTIAAPADADEMNAFLNKEVLSGNIAAVEPTGSLEKAQELMYQAVDSVGRKRVQLARKALKICPDCADAYVILAEQSGDEQKAHDLYAQGVAAGERALGPEIFEEDAGRFWGILETRPYMRARLGLAEILEAMGRLEEAADHYREMLRLNQNDNQGVRHMLVPCLLEMGCDDEAEEILKRYKADFLALWTYPRALVTFRKKGDTATARKHLRKAIEENEYVPHYLLGRRDWPIEFPSSYSPGSGDEAILCADVLADVWQETPGAIEWLEEQLEAKPTRKSTKKRTR